MAEAHNNSRAYEVIFILRPSLGDEEIAGELEKVKATITQKAGEVVWSENIGRKKLAHEIQKEKRGVFILIHFKGSPKTLFELQRIWRLQDIIMRFMMVKIRPQDLCPSAGGKGTSSCTDAHPVPMEDTANDG